MSGYETRAIFDGDNIVSDADLVDAAGKLAAFGARGRASTGASRPAPNAS